MDALKGKQDEAWAIYKKQLSEKDAIKKGQKKSQFFHIVFFHRAAEIDELYKKKREFTASRKKELDAHHEAIRAQQRAKRNEESKRREEEKKAMQEARQRDRYNK